MVKKNTVGLLAMGICIALSIAPVFLALLNYIDNYFGDSIWIMFLLLILLALIVVLFIIALIQLTELLIFMLFFQKPRDKIKYAVVFPFVYDGRIWFRPSKLFNSSEFYRGILALNLVDGSMNRWEIRLQLKKCILFRKRFI